MNDHLEPETSKSLADLASDTWEAIDKYVKTLQGNTISNQSHRRAAKYEVSLALLELTKYSFEEEFPSRESPEVIEAMKIIEGSQ